MKFQKMSMFVAAVLIFGAACNPYKIEIPHWPYEDPDWVDDGTGGGTFDPEAAGSTAVYPSGAEKVRTLQTDGYFTTTPVADGIVLYRMSRICDVSDALQDVYVLEIDLDNPDYRVYFNYSANTTSGAAKNLNAIVAVNGTYEPEAVYIRTQGKNHEEVDLDENHLRFWKHSGAIVGDGGRQIAIVNGAGKYQMHSKEAGLNAIELYKKLPEPNIFAAAPMLIDDYKPVGETFVPDYLTSSELNKFDSEDFRRHQGVRHPRTAYALTDDNDLLLIVVDGRTSKAAGMSAKELTLFIQKHFNPRWAINMDGGGSSAMFVKGMGNQDNIINNYTDTDDDGNPVERRVTSHIIIQKTAQ